MNSTQEAMFEYTMQDLVLYLMEDYGFSMESAMDTVFASDTFQKLSDPETGLYLEGSAYVYEFLKEELADTEPQA